MLIWSPSLCLYIILPLYLYHYLFLYIKYLLKKFPLPCVLGGGVYGPLNIYLPDFAPKTGSRIFVFLYNVMV